MTSVAYYIHSVSDSLGYDKVYQGQTRLHNHPWLRQAEHTCHTAAVGVHDGDGACVSKRNDVEYEKLTQNTILTVQCDMQ